MMLDYRELLKIGAVSAFAYLFVSQVKELYLSIQDAAEIQQKEVTNLAQIEHLLKSKDKTRLNIVKLKPYYFQMQQKVRPIRSAEKFKFQPSDQDIVKHFTKKLSYPIPNRKNVLHKIPCQWFAISQTTNGIKHYKIDGFGIILGDFFNIEKTYQPIKKLGYWRRFRNWTARQFVKILPNSKKIGSSNSIRPFFLGPVVGYLNYEIDLMRDTNIVAVCNIEDGRIIPTVTALSKSDILAYFQTKIQNNYLKVGGFLMLTIVIGRWLWSDIKALLNTLKVKRQKMSSNYFNPQVTDDKVCIICYSNCRNMIFFDCRHMIMCRDCSVHYKSDVCPYCKLEIDQIKMVNAVVGQPNNPK